MNGYDQFHQDARRIASAFASIPKNHLVRVISHLDCDGICAASLLIRVLSNMGIKYSASTLHYLNESHVQSLKKEEYEYFVFLDIGATQIDTLEQMDATVFVIDHHPPQHKDTKKGNIYHLNPHLAGIDGGREASGASVVFYFCYQLDSSIEDMAHLAVTGSIGDSQEKQGFEGLNAEVLETAKQGGIVKQEHTLRVCNNHTRPLHKELEFCTDPFIPGVTGSDHGALNLIQEAGLPSKQKGRWICFRDLTTRMKEALAQAVIHKRRFFKNPSDIYGYSYMLPHEKQGSAIRDVREFSTLLNACGRLDKASLGIGTCLGFEHCKEKAQLQLNEYRQELLNAMEWFKQQEGDTIIKGTRYMIINAGDHIHSTMVGTLASILSKSNVVSEGTFILALAHCSDGLTTKVSFRYAGQDDSQDIDLGRLMREMLAGVDGSGGGHTRAAGATVPTEREHLFVQSAQAILEKYGVEERIAS